MHLLEYWGSKPEVFDPTVFPCCCFVFSTGCLWFPTFSFQGGGEASLCTFAMSLGDESFPQFHPQLREFWDDFMLFEPLHFYCPNIGHMRQVSTMESSKGYKGAGPWLGNRALLSDKSFQACCLHWWVGMKMQVLWVKGINSSGRAGSEGRDSGLFGPDTSIRFFLPCCCSEGSSHTSIGVRS